MAREGGLEKSQVVTGFWGAHYYLESFSPRVIQKPESQHRIPAAHPILIYAELLHHGTDRDRETAQLMYKEFLEDSIAKD